MALISCPECSHQVSNTAFKCPSCAVQLKKLKRSTFGKWVVFAFSAFNILMMVMTVWDLNLHMNQIISPDPSSEAYIEGFGKMCATGIDFAAIFGIWLAGDLFLGTLFVFTIPKS